MKCNSEAGVEFQARYRYGNKILKSDCSVIEHEG